MTAITGALDNLGHEGSDQTVGRGLRRRGRSPAPERKRTTTGAEFIRVHFAVLAGNHAERNHQGKGNVLLFQRVTEARRGNPLRCRERLGGLLRYYHQNAA